MTRIDKEIIVNSSIEKVFSYISEPSNWPEFWPSLMEIDDGFEACGACLGSWGGYHMGSKMDILLVARAIGVRMSHCTLKWEVTN